MSNCKAMADYISREAASDLLTMALIDDWEPEYAQDRLSEIPAADVRPVVRGEWASVFDIGTVCNRCGYDIEAHGFDVRTDGEPNFCPNCGADMRGEN